MPSASQKARTSSPHCARFQLSLRTVLASAIAAVVEIDDLGDIGQGRVGRPVDRVVETGTAMKHQQRRLFPHRRAVGHELRALDIEEQPHPVHGHVHVLVSLVDERSRPTKPLACFEADTKPYRNQAFGFGSASHNSGVLPLSMCSAFDVTRFSSSGQNVIQDFSTLPAPRRSPRCWLVCADLVRTDHVPWERSPQGPASPGAIRRRRPGNADPAAGEPAAAADRPERGAAIPQPPARGAAAAARRRRRPRPAASRRSPSPACAAVSRRRSQPQLRQVRQATRQPARLSASASPAMQQPQIAAPAPIVQEPAAPAGRRPPPRRCVRSRTRTRMRPARRARSAAASCRSPARRRSARPADAGRASRSISAHQPARSRRRAGRRPPRGRRRQRRADHAAALGDAEGRVRSRHRLHAAQGLCAGRRDHENFAQKYPSDPLVADSQYWLGESYFQRQQYRDAAEAFLGVTTKFDKSAQGAGCAAAARPVAGGAEGKGSRLRRARRGDAEISARLGRRQSRPWTASRSG